MRTIETLRRTELFTPAGLTFTPGPLLVQRPEAASDDCAQGVHEEQYR
ncbi:MAG: hypothetical protein MPW15_15755 [Candidatus Manganitrophus sp.]|nr:hypothetical protein [Candidatus Manganitrophus sp.]